jgi:hypothetical protein
MVGMATTGAARKLRRPTDASCKRELARRRQIEQRFASAYGRSPRADKLDNLTGFVLWLDRCRARDGDEILRSVPQIVRAMKRELGWQPRAGVRANRDAYRAQIRRQLDTLQAIGWLDSWDSVLRPNGEGVGIVIRLSADVAQLAKAPPRRRAQHGRQEGTTRTRRRAFSEPEMHPPSRGCVELRSPQPITAVGACAPGRLPPPDGRDRAELYDRARAALAASAVARAGEKVPDTLARLPWLAELPAADVARAALAAYHPDVAPRITLRRQQQLDRAVRRLDRYADMGKGRRGVGIEQLVAACRELAPPWEGAGRPRSLGAVAVVLHRQSLKWRRAHKPPRKVRASS